MHNHPGQPLFQRFHSGRRFSARPPEGGYPLLEAINFEDVPNLMCCLLNCDVHSGDFHSLLLNGCAALQVTGHIITPCRFAVLRDDEVHGWLGASPDGLIDSFSAQPGVAHLHFL